MAKTSSANVKMTKSSSSSTAPGSSTAKASSSSKRLSVDRPWQSEQDPGHSYQTSTRDSGTSEPFTRWLDEPTGLGPYNNIAEVAEGCGAYTTSSGGHQSSGVAATCKTKHGQSKEHKKKHHGK
ncbi:hypothetical protein VD0004_g9879 [Verticillium dahliae]|uniref:Uncharacterized protein n=2 Tax=Verticillium dahliae TaxID=27337 RepID=G2XJI3_VERDV|nr:uncharacterized protein VDAG_10384 [Verticillium dahliae VdLs.17]KAF3361071.1 hypothetical protein VdG1_04712 [Verticillium dahliae VDG1]KAH6700056.1 hypothetical protein EV126DRAFT_341843 [Verticillium dahliae]EGY20686.1 hypothetical protein VDAG_10384 [Verticillium dahliae VdLs.17]PNH36888.1 hypothetical protein VD0004_g9879 [Verticillium dahliae]PNH60372.1 hypothetical protein VD0001_g9861 [Verticillium dahliae]